MTKAKIITDAHCVVPNAHIAGRAGKGKAACGALVIDERGMEYEFKKYLGEMTVPEAEFRALIFALDEASAVVRFDVEIMMDSELVVKWMRGEYRMRKPHIRPLFDDAKKLAQRFKSVEYFHHSRNSQLGIRVDRLAHQAYQEYQT